MPQVMIKLQQNALNERNINYVVRSIIQNVWSEYIV